jgi:hypothetical protein
VVRLIESSGLAKPRFGRRARPGEPPASLTKAYPGENSSPLTLGALEFRGNCFVRRSK